MTCFTENHVFSFLAVKCAKSVPEYFAEGLSKSMRVGVSIRLVSHYIVSTDCYLFQSMRHPAQRLKDIPKGFQEES